jgi:hypothetical protein
VCVCVCVCVFMYILERRTVTRILELPAFLQFTNIALKESNFGWGSWRVSRRRTRG